jgi:hypothetical protein
MRGEVIGGGGYGVVILRVKLGGRLLPSVANTTLARSMSTNKVT